MPINIRQAVPGDEASLIDIGRRTFTETFGHLYRPADLNAYLHSSHSTECYSRHLQNDRTRAWLVEQNDLVKGYACVGPCDLPVDDLPANAGELQRLYVLQEIQGSGVGTQLLEMALTFLDRHFDAQFISVYAENTGAQRLYGRYGFEKIQEYDYMVGSHADPEWIMKRRRD